MPIATHFKLHFLSLFLISAVFLPAPALRADGESDQLNSQKSQLENEVNSLNAEIAATQAQIAAQQAELNRLASSEADLQQKLAEDSTLEANLDSQLAQLEKVKLDAQTKLEEGRQSQSSFEQQVAELKKKLNQIELQSAQLNEQNKATALEVSALSKDVDASKAQETILNEQVNSMRSTVSDEEKFVKEQLLTEPLIEQLDELKADWMEIKSLRAVRASGDIPETAVGKLRTPFGVCTAFLVGSDRVRTAAHCVHDINVFGEKSGYTFVAADGTSTTALYHTRYSERADFIELQLKHRVELEVAEFTDLNPEAEVQIFAFDVLTGDYVRIDCRVVDFKASTGLIKTDCPTSLGMSGAPLFQNGKVVAFHIGKWQGISIEMVSDPRPGQELSDDQAAKITYEYNCDSDCGEEVGFNYPCPTFRNPGRTCHASKIIPNPVCEAAKQNDCVLQAAARESERVLSRLKEELRNGINSLGIQSSQLKVSLNGLRVTLTDVGNAAVGRNQSIKDLQGKILETATRIESKRAELTKATLFLEQTNSATAEILKSVGVSKEDIHNIELGLETATQSNSQLELETKALKEAKDSLLKEQEGVMSRISLQEINLQNLTGHLSQIRQEGNEKLQQLGKKIAEMPQELTVPILGIWSFDEDGRPRIFTALKHLSSSLKKGIREAERSLKKLKLPSSKDCDSEDVKSKTKCLQKKRAELEEKQDSIKGLLRNFEDSVARKLGGAGK